MAHTRPDYSTQQKMATIYGEVDNGELAARLKSINTYDRRGKIVWLDDFESAVLKWDGAGAGLGNAAAVNAAWSRNGDSSCKLTCGSSAPQFGGIEKGIQPPFMGHLGLEASCFFDADVTAFFIDLTMFDGTYMTYCRFAIDIALGLLQYYTDAGAWATLINGLTFINDRQMIYTLKIVADFSTGYYVRGMYGGVTYDMTALPMYHFLDATTPQLYVNIYAAGTIATNAVCYVDDVIVTQDEP